MELEDQFFIDNISAKENYKITEYLGFPLKNKEIKSISLTMKLDEFLKALSKGSTPVEKALLNTALDADQINKIPFTSAYHFVFQEAQNTCLIIIKPILKSFVIE